MKKLLALVLALSMIFGLAACGQTAKPAEAAPATEAPKAKLKVVIPGNLNIGEELTNILSLDPRPAYQDVPGKVYGMLYAGRDIKFKVEGDTLTVLSAEKA